MQWKDEGYLLSKNNYSENSVIIEVFTLNHGKCPGIVYGGTSRRIKNYLQLGNKIHVNLKAKNESKLGYFKIEIIDPISPFFFDDNKKINCLFSSLNLLKTVLPEMLSYNSIYILFSNSRPIANSKEDNIDYPIVETIKLISKKHVINITAYGEIISEKVVRIKYRDKGKIIRIGKNINNGEYLRKGDLLFEVDSFNIKNDLKEKYLSKKIISLNIKKII